MFDLELFSVFERPIGARAGAIKLPGRWPFAKP
jgi:hypothetical protein